MSQPTPYNRSFSFSSFQESNPNTPLPGNRVDIEYNNVKITLDELIANLGLIQRDDGALQNGIVTQSSLSDSLSIGFTFRGEWTSGAAYSQADGVAYNGKFYVALAGNTASVTNRPDLDSTTWSLSVDFTTIALNSTGSMIPFALSGDGSTTVFTLPASVANANNLILTVSGVLQRATGDYTASGTTLTFTSAPPAGTDNIFGQIFNVVSVSGSLPAASVSISPSVSGGSDAQTVFTTHAALISAASSAAATAHSTATTATTNAATALAAANAAQADADTAYTEATTGTVAGTRIGTGTLPFAAIASAAFATQADAEAGASSTKLMTPQRTAQAIAAAGASSAGRLLGVTQFTSSGTWTKATLNPGFIVIEVIGAGGGGGGAANPAASNVTVGGGGGAGGYSRKKVLAASLGATETVTIGAAGTAGANTGGTGGTGGTSSFGAHATATGGAGGVGSTGQPVNSRAGGAGGSGASGDLNMRGAPGGHGFGVYNATNSAVSGGNGGSSIQGGGAVGAIVTGGTASAAGAAGLANSGGGGSGAASVVSGAVAGGAGGTGYVLVWEYA